MNLKQVKYLVNITGDLRKLVKEYDGIRIYDLFINVEGNLMLEQYSVINKSELEEIAQEKNEVINADTVDTLLSCVKLWYTSEQDENFLNEVKEFFDNFDVEKVSTLPQLSFNDTVIEFIDSDLNEILYRGV